MKSLRFHKLADRPDAVPLVAEWYFGEWGHLNPAATPEKIAARLSASMNRDAIPLVVLAVTGDEVIGSAELKYREMTIYPEKEHWLGGVFVVPEHRGKGVAARLIDAVINSARVLGVDVLHIQTERLDGGLYLKLGWQRTEQVRYRGLDVLVMEREL
ncbi:MAG: GNAT family N-acetyltransferase [Woeseiaceae bacterium]|jgi:GNAT superfamily N-acetyltransferase